MDLLGGLFADAAVVPDFLGGAGYLGFAGGIAEDEAVFIAVLLQPEGTAPPS